jgi:hypothetical protein
MSRRERDSKLGRDGDDDAGEGPRAARPGVGRRGTVRPPRYGGYIGLFALLILGLITINTVLTKPNGASGIVPGGRLAPFAVPLAKGDLQGDANVATHANEGTAGRMPACTVRGGQILNVCELYERGPVVLALFVDAGSCPGILSDMQQLAPSFPGVSFAAVAIKPSREQLRRLLRSRGVTFPVGVDSDGVLAGLYKVASCPQVTFALPGGEVQSRALLSRPATATLRARVSELVGAARARGWRPPRR